jgi:hypothetical protein
MKLSKAFVAQSAFLYTVSLLCALGFSTLFTSNFNSMHFEWFLLFISLIALVVFVFDIYDGRAYIQQGYFKNDKYKVHEFKNMTIIEMHGFAWSYTYRFEEIAKLKWIKAEGYYNIKKKFIGSQLLPYATLEEIEKEKKHGNKGDKTAS